MHPVSYLFEEIYRDYWGIPVQRDTPERRRAEEAGWRRQQARRRQAR